MMIEKASGKLVGHCGLKRVDSPGAKNQGDHELGWLVREDRWRRGYAGEAAGAVLSWAFGPLGAPHVVALTGPGNGPSWRRMEKLGMKRCGDLEFDDPAYSPEENPTLVHRLLRVDWVGA